MLKTNFETVQAAVDAHDVNRTLTCYRPDAHITAPGAELHGTDQIGAWYQVFITGFPDIHHEILGTIEDSGSSAAQVRVTGTHTGPLPSPNGDIVPTGKRLDLEYVVVSRFDNARIKGEKYYWDNQTFLTQLGLI